MTMNVGEVSNGSKLIAIVGGIAVGKTTIGKKLLTMIPGMEFVEEDVEKNVFLEDFYGDMRKWAFHSRISTLAMIASGYIHGETGSRFILMDRCLDELITFARLQYEKGNLSDREFSVYQQLYDWMVAFAPQIDGYVYCFCDPAVSMERIRKRSRKFEQGIDFRYLECLNREYDRWMEKQKQGKVYRVNTGEKVDVEKIKEFILNI